MTIAPEQLKQYIERIERLTEEKQGIADDIKSIFAQAKSDGYDNKAMRAVLKQRKMEKAEVEELEALVDTYKHALGME